MKKANIYVISGFIIIIDNEASVNNFMLLKTLALVGVTGIEPAPSWSQTKRLTIRQHPDKIFNFFSTMVKPVVRPVFAASARCNFLAFLPFFARMLAFLKTAAGNDCTLPKLARYQLRHPSMCEKYSILGQIP